MDDLPAGIRRVTLPLPGRPGHVHAYLLPGEDGWTVVDTGVGLPDARERWAAELEGLGPVARVFVTHFHPDHVGAARGPRGLTGAPVLQGAARPTSSARSSGGRRGGARSLADWFHRHGVPTDVTAELVERGSWWLPFVRFAHDAVPVEPGDLIEGWELVAAPGHADGQLMLLRDGILVAGDHLLDPITPTVGLWPASRPDPLGDYLAALEVVVERAPRLALPGHGEPIARPGRTSQGARRAPPRAAGGDRRRARRRAAQRVRGLAAALRRGAEAERAPLRRRRDALAPRAARARGRRRAARGRRRRDLYCRLSGRRASAQYLRPVWRGAPLHDA